MRDRKRWQADADRSVEPPSPLFTIDKVENAPRDPLLRQVIGSFRSTSFFERRPKTDGC